MGALSDAEANMKRTTKRIFAGGGALLLIALLYAAFAPLPEDELPPAEKYGAGSSSVEPAYSGLLRQFPALNEPADNPTTPDKAELGKLLFFDPILSKNNDMSCASCHHPDLGFADGLPAALGAGGQPLKRSAMSLWNVGFESSFFWDGRAPSLEEQLLTPLTRPDEMAADPGEIEAELRAIPAYVDAFEKVFGTADPVQVENVQKAIAAFERTLVSQESPFDYYAQGQFEALTAQQRRGLALFRSAATRCFECHAAPTFGDEDYFVTGVPDSGNDPGRAAVAAEGQPGAFKAPSLRNIALTAPYMHNGAFQTLEQVVDFYAKGGGRSEGVANIDQHVIGFELNATEKADLVAFLYALTDEKAMTFPIPPSVPSGLPVEAPRPNPARDLVRQMNVPFSESGLPPAHTPVTVNVGPGETIQQAVDRAGPGDTIQVPYGVYTEAVVIDWSDIRLIGIPNNKGDWPLLEGEGTRADGVIASGNNFEMGFFQVKNYTSNGVLVEGATGVNLHDLYVEKTGVYGVYPVRSTDVLIERVEATGMNDAGIYAGKCENVIVRDNVAHGNVIGIEVENTVNAEIYGNHAYDNSLGIFVDLLPQLPSKVSLNTRVHDNLIENNNGENFAPQDSNQALVRTGTGLLFLAADRAEAYTNTIRGNKTAGIGVFNLSIGFDVNEIDVGPNPEHNRIHDNTLENNGYDADPFIKDMLGRGFDVIWDGTGADNRFDQPGASSFPPALPGPDWPQPAYNLYWRLLNFVTGLIG